MPAVGTVAVTLLVRGSTRVSVPSLRLLTQIAPGVATAWYDVEPTRIFATTRPVCGSTRSSVPDCVTIQRAPYATVIAHGSGSRAVVATTLPVLGFSRNSRPLAGSLIQTAPAVPATPHGLPPTCVL